MNLKFSAFVGLLILSSLTAVAQIVDPVHATFSLDGDSIKYELQIEEGWELHDADLYVDTLEDGTIKGYLEYTACNDEMCIPPTRAEFSFEPQGEVADADAEGNDGILAIFIGGILAGFLALLTPCVWPIIPLTVSSFLKRGKHEAILFGISIVLFYVCLGLFVTMLFGADALNAISTSAVFNLIAFAVLVLFGLSLFGLFELTLPSHWANKLDGMSSKGSWLTPLFMALTLVIVSFSCTAPVVGFLLVEAVSHDITGPAVGMLGFGLALALPFTVFALVPGWMKSMPKSGSWMNDVKVVLGTLELAFSLKFLSVADLSYGWGILPRWLFIALWAALGLWLCVYFAKQTYVAHNAKKRKAGLVYTYGVLSFLGALFCIYMLGGYAGRPLKEVSAFLPPMEIKTDGDFEEALMQSRETGKPVFVDFTGYGCVNCRKMEATVFQDERVQAMLRDSFITVTLYVDDKTALPEPIVEDGETLETVGQRWSHLQRVRYGANAQPFYLLLDADGNLLTDSRAYNEDTEAFLSWLKSVL